MLWTPTRWGNTLRLRKQVWGNAEARHVVLMYRDSW